MNKAFAAVLTALMVCAIGVAAPAKEAKPTGALVETAEGLEIDWTARRLKLKGVGMAPDRGNFTQRRLMAKRSAYADGYRRLAEIVNRLRVDSNAFVRDITAVDDQARLAVNELVLEAQAKEVRQWSDGSVELEFEVPLERIATVFLQPASSSISVSKEDTHGVIIDARGTGMQPALQARVRDLGGNSLLPDGYPLPYYHTVDAAAEQVGKQPLTLKARRASGSTRADVMLAEAEAKKLKEALEKHLLPVVILL